MIARDATEFAVQLLRDQIHRKVTPVHRLDRKTGGVLLFALDVETLKQMNLLFDQGKVSKKYLAIVRGYCDDEGTIDYPLKKENGNLQDAVTHYRTLERTEIDVLFGKHSTQRYSLVEVIPETGRMHQIRKHFAHIFHPLIGDRPHGCNKQNRLFKEKWSMTTMMLHASEVDFIHPSIGELVKVEAPLQMEFLRTLGFLRFQFNGLGQI
ncbi:MAG: pseudouridylate synthase [Prolixibacteraceae bacterium]|nr:pseudouridylate synthase [Prolixibacteraceae bacterium]